MRNTKYHRGILLALIAACIAGLAFVAIAFGPKTRHSSMCRFCGRWHYEVWRLGIKTSDKIIESDWSAWVDSIQPAHTQHVWALASSSRRKWGGTARMGDYEGNVVVELYASRKQIGEAKARELLAKYHASSEVGWAKARDFWVNELSPLLTNNNQETKAP